MTGLPFTIAELKAFVMVARSLSFTHAARGLGITQPALSMTIRQVEAKFGATLFDRSTRSVKLSSTGALLHPVAERLIENFERTIAGMREIAMRVCGGCSRRHARWPASASSCSSRWRG